MTGDDGNRTAKHLEGTRFVKATISHYQGLGFGLSLENGQLISGHYMLLIMMMKKIALGLQIMCMEKKLAIRLESLLEY